MKQATLRPQSVEFIPEHLEDGVLYISQRYQTATHRCCCGCGEEVVTPLSPTDWSLRIVNGAVTLYPSIGNWSFACRSHYWIREGKVVWAGSMTQRQIGRARMREQRIRDAYFAEVNHHKEAPPAAPAPQQATRIQLSSGWIDAAWKALKKWLGFAA